MDDVLGSILERQRRRGLLGPAAIADQIAHGTAFARAVTSDGGGEPDRVVDLGSGGGVPGFVLAAEWPDADVVLVDASQRRCTYLEIEASQLRGQVRVVCSRAEVLGRSAEWRGWASVVVARSFGPPAVTAECASPLLSRGGLLVVSDPPDGSDRWVGVSQLGLAVVRSVRIEGSNFTIMRQETECPSLYPRRRPDRPLLF